MKCKHTRTKTVFDVTGMGGLPFGGQTLGMGAEKTNAKYGECLSIVSFHCEVAWEVNYTEHLWLYEFLANKILPHIDVQNMCHLK